MNSETALAFLRQHQPLPPTRDVSDQLLKEFDDIRKYFASNIDPRCLPLLLGALGEGDGHGIYQRIADTLRQYPETEVVHALKETLQSPNEAVRTWSAEIAALYPSEQLLEALASVFLRGQVDAQQASAIAIGQIGTPAALEQLNQFLRLNLEEPVQEMLREALSTR
jgi:HEAT repeat protein